jgi:hypothetical protein
MTRQQKLFFFLIFFQCTLSISDVCFGQTPFTEGYYVVNGDTLHGFVEERESYLKDDVQFKKDLSGEPQTIKPRFCSRTIQSDLVAGLYFGHLRIIHHTIAFF